MRSIITEKIVSAMRGIFARHGMPLPLRTDNGLQFVSEEFRAFAERNRIELMKTDWPQANGEVENANRQLGKRLKIAHQDRVDYAEAIGEFLLMYNATLHGTTGTPPAELMFGRQIRDRTPGIEDLVTGDVDCRERDTDITRKNRELQDANNRRRAKEPGICVGDEVVLKNHTLGHKLTPTFGEVKYVVVQRAANVLTMKGDGKTVTRHISHVKKIATRPEEAESPST